MRKTRNSLLKPGKLRTSISKLIESVKSRYPKHNDRY